MPVVRWQSRRGNDLLYIDLQEIEDRQRDALWRCRPREKGTILSATFELDDQEFIALNGGPMFKFSPAISLFVKCETQEEIDDFWAKLLKGGAPQQCGWLTDKFGVSWQIVPTILSEMLRDKDPVKANRVMQSMLKMIKLDIKLLQQAYDQE